MELVLDSGAVVRGFKAIGREDHIRIALSDACEAVMKEAMERHDFDSISGELENAITYDVNPSELTGEVFIDSNLAPYGIYVHEPTGTHAKKAGRKLNESKYYRWPDGSYAIRPVNAKMLRFIGASGEETFRSEVRHRGSPADPFIYEALERKETDVIAKFRAGVQQAIEGAGLL